MKIHIVLFCCLCRSLAGGAQYKTTGSANASANTKEYKETLKDIRLVSVTDPEPLQKPALLLGREQDQHLKQTRTTVRPKITITRESLGNLGGEKKVTMASQARLDDSQKENSSNRAQMQKIANQLYLAQKRASLLSDYQKFILSQDANVKSFVLGQLTENRSPKSFSSKRLGGSSLSTQPKTKYVTTEPPTGGSIDLGKIVVVTPKVQTAVEKISRPHNDHKAQGTRLKYVTLAPQSLTHLVDAHEPDQKVTLLPYRAPQPYTYYNLRATSTPHIETVRIPTTASLGSVGLGSYNSPQPQRLHDEDEHEDKLNYDNSKYEFTYKVKDHGSNSHFGHKESRSDQTTYGYYFVQLPDGRLETVKYWADKTGYHAKVDYQGQAKHPTQIEPKINSFHFVYH